jgi:tRNA 5-methylaminomethyl-2-thiouridine biosynthesis bifunctional protein
VDPAALARSFTQRAGAATRFRGSLAVMALRRQGAHWQLLDAAGQVIDEATTVVLANAADALRLLHITHWPVQQVRGQISLYANAVAPPGLQMQLPTLPLAGAGYVLPAIDGRALFGASNHPFDEDAAARDADHAANLLRLQALSPHTLPPSTSLQTALESGLLPGLLTGKVGWRCVASDRLPLLGAVPDKAALAASNVGRAREVPRLPGLHVFTALASRGITWAALGGQVLAAQICGAPVPLEASLVDAVDPARFALRAKRRDASRPQPQSQPCD